MGMNPKLLSIIKEAVHQELTNLRVRDLIAPVPELSKLYDICKNEIDLLSDDKSVEQYYNAIYINAVLQHFGLTNGLVPMDMVDRMLNKSINAIEAKKQFKQITNPNHLLPAMLLKMINDRKTFSIQGVNNGNLDTIRHLITYRFTGNTHYSKSYLEKILRSKIVIN